VVPVGISQAFAPRNPRLGLTTRSKAMMGSYTDCGRTGEAEATWKFIPLNNWIIISL
jgi:hypothetical protein